MLDKVLNRTSVLEKALDTSWLKNETISQNLANVDTPNYKRKTVVFDELLNQAMDKNALKGQRTDSRHIPINEVDISSLEPEVRTDNQELSTRLDGNNVDVEKEMSDLAKNTIQYNVLIQSISGKFKSIKSAITEGRR